MHTTAGSGPAPFCGIVNTISILRPGVDWMVISLTVNPGISHVLTSLASNGIWPTFGTRSSSFNSLEKLRADVVLPGDGLLGSARLVTHFSEIEELLLVLQVLLESLQSFVPVEPHHHVGGVDVGAIGQGDQFLVDVDRSLQVIQQCLGILLVFGCLGNIAWRWPRTPFRAMPGRRRPAPGCRSRSAPPPLDSPWRLSGPTRQGGSLLRPFPPADPTTLSGVIAPATVWPAASLSA